MQVGAGKGFLLSNFHTSYRQLWSNQL